MDATRPSRRNCLPAAGVERLESRTMLSGVTRAAPRAAAAAVADAVAPVAAPARAWKPVDKAPKAVAPAAAPARPAAKPATVFRAKPPAKPAPVPLPPRPGGGLPALPGDLNGDGVVDNGDFRVFHRNYGRTDGTVYDGDLNVDGVINFTDFQLLELNFGRRLPRTNYATVGTNLDGIADYASISPFVDLARMFRPWGRPELAHEPDPTIRRTADNYPLEDAGAITYAKTYPNGVYQVTWDGTADLSFMGTGVSFQETGDFGGTLTLDRPKDDDVIALYVKNVDEADPLHNLRIVSPDADYNVSDTFRPVFLDKLRPFNGPLRAMDWMQTNWNPSVEWSDRTSPTEFSNVNETGVDYETIIKLANTLHKNLWVNVPYGASDDYIAQTARLFREQLDPSLTLYVENSNEVWNNMFGQSQANARLAAEDPTLTKDDPFGREAQMASKQVVRIAQIFRREFGDERYRAQVETVFGGLIATTYWIESGLDYIAQTYGPVTDYVSHVAVAPYVGVPGDMAHIDNENLTLSGLFAWMNSFINTNIRTWVREHKQLADRYGIGLHSYEGGQSLQALNGMNEPLKRAAQDDPRMGDVYHNLIQTWHDESGGGIFGNFAVATDYTNFGYWGLLQDIAQPTSVKWDAVMATIAY